MKQNYLSVGKVTSTHGVRGEVRIQPFTDYPEQFKAFSTLYFDNKGKEAIKVLGIKIAKNMPVLKFEGINSVEEGQALLRRELFANREDFSLEEGSYFIVDLIGLQVEDSETGQSYGEIVDITQTGANDVYHVKTPEGKLLYVPAIKEVVMETDLEEGKMRIKPLEGLFDED